VYFSRKQEDGARARNSDERAWRQLTAEQRRLILEGDPRNEYEGVKGFFQFAGAQEIQAACPRFPEPLPALCEVSRMWRDFGLRAEARAVRVAGKAITEVCKLTVKEARAFFSTLQLSEGT